MKKFTSLSSIAMPLDRANIDTDAIIPKQFLKSIKSQDLIWAQKILKRSKILLIIERLTNVF